VITPLRHELYYYYSPQPPPHPPTKRTPPPLHAQAILAPPSSLSPQPQPTTTVFAPNITTNASSSTTAQQQQHGGNTGAPYRHPATTRAAHCISFSSCSPVAFGFRCGSCGGCSAMDTGRGCEWWAREIHSSSSSSSSSMPHPHTLGYCPVVITDRGSHRNYYFFQERGNWVAQNPLILLLLLLVWKVFVIANELLQGSSSD
jgi:hypothetical protein